MKIVQKLLHEQKSAGGAGGSINGAIETGTQTWNHPGKPAWYTMK